MNLFFKFVRQLLYFSAAVGAATVILSLVLPDQYISPTLPFLLLLFTSTSLLSFYYLLRSLDKRFIRFLNVFLLSIIFKLLFYSLIMVSYAFTFRWDAVPFLMAFFILYVLYMIFETVCIVRINPPSAGQQTGSESSVS